jgi:hypothetical protein
LILINMNFHFIMLNIRCMCNKDRMEESKHAKKKCNDNG